MYNIVIRENIPKYDTYYQMYRKLYPALKDFYKELATL